MKKITLLAALLGTVYFSNAQVGIGTSEPSPSAMLEVFTETLNPKGVLIPRVALTDSGTVLKSGVNQENSLLVYNTAVGVIKDKEVTPGFYYWSNTGSAASTTGKWIRIVNQADLDAAVQNQTTDLEKIKKLLDAAYGSNNLGATPTSDTYGGMVFAPGASGAPAKIEYVRWNPTLNSPTSGGYEKIDITDIISSLLIANESNTSLIGDTDKKYQYYISEKYIKDIKEANNGVYTAPTQTVIDGWDAAPPTGVFMIDFVNGISNNFLELSTTFTNIEKSTGVNYTVKEYIEFLAQNTNANGDTKIALTGAGTPENPFVAKLQRWDASLTIPAWVDVDNSVFKTIVKDNETDTRIDKNQVGTVANGDIVIDYKYFNEASDTVAQQTIDLNADVLNLINGNTIIKNAIQNIVSANTNVGYTPGGIAAGTTELPNGVLDNVAIPAKSFYYINTDGLKVEIPLNDIVYQGISQFTTEQINSTKFKLGDKLTNVSVFTGDTIEIDDVVYYVYKGVFETTITGGTANTSGITLDKPLKKIISTHLTYDGGASASITGLVATVVPSTGTVTGATLAFKIGVGLMYTVVSPDNKVAEVVVEFASTNVPAGVTL